MRTSPSNDLASLISLSYCCLTLPYTTSHSMDTNMKNSSWLFLVLCVTLTLPSSSKADMEKIGPRLAESMGRASSTDELYAWVFFTDKGRHELNSTTPASVVSERSIQRRLKVRPYDQVVDYADLPVEESYVAEVATYVRTVRQRSKWFNAVSVAGTREQILVLQHLPFVGQLDLVARFPKSDPDVQDQEVEPGDIASPATSSNLLLDYGPSLPQLSQINVPALHDLGNYGQDVFVGVFDNGFRLLTHQAFSTMNILATYDFVDHKISVVPNNPSSSFGGHGVNTLSTIGGYTPGQLIGPAFGSTYILARTENDSSETPVEEDNWVAGIEWMDSIGVDVTSTSLGYLDYDPPFPSWTWQNMDGNTTLITRAADMAVGRGIVVVNSAGNEGLNTTHNTLIAPADGDSVLAIGAVNSTGVRSSFSSVGPTTSVPPRIKPDVMARGSSVVVASSTNPSSFTTSSGTSFSCPLAAGVVALIVHARPAATPMQIVDALKSTASNALTPNNQMGWGIINAVAAIEALEVSGVGQEPGKPSGYELLQNYPNPFNPSTTIRYVLPEPADVTITIHDVLGKRVRALRLSNQPAATHAFFWDGTNDIGSPVSSGTYLYRMVAVAHTSGAVFSESRSMVLLK